MSVKGKNFRRLSREEELEMASRAKAGDAEAANALILSMYGFICQIAIRHAEQRNKLVRLSQVDPDDVTADYVIAMYERLPKFDPERGRLSTYTAICLGRLGRRTVLNEAEAPMHLVSKVCSGDAIEGREPFMNTQPARGPSPADQAELREQVAAVRSAIRALKPKDRSVIKERFFQSLGLKEIAKARGVSKERARQLVGIATEKLLESMP